MDSDKDVLEVISIKNQASEISKDYDEFCSKEWSAAKAALDVQGLLEKKEQLIFLKEILMVIVYRKLDKCIHVSLYISYILSELLHFQLRQLVVSQNMTLAVELDVIFQP